jgi:uncharacterized membrane protein
MYWYQSLSFFFVKLILLWFITLQLTNVMARAKANFTIPVDDGLRKTKNVTGNREYLYIRTVLCRC